MNKSTIKNASNPTSSGSGEGKHDLIDRQAAIDALAKQMPESYTLDGSHPADEEIFMAQEIYADCIKAIELLPAVQPETATVTIGRTKGGVTMWYECDACGEPINQKDCYCRNCGRKLTLPEPYRGDEKAHDKV